MFRLRLLLVLHHGGLAALVSCGVSSSSVGDGMGDVGRGAAGRRAVMLESASVGVCAAGEHVAGKYRRESGGAVSLWRSAIISTASCNCRGGARRSVGLSSGGSAVSCSCSGGAGSTVGGTSGGSAGSTCVGVSGGAARVAGIVPPCASAIAVGLGVSGGAASAAGLVPGAAASAVGLAVPGAAAVADGREVPGAAVGRGFAASLGVPGAATTAAGLGVPGVADGLGVKVAAA